MEGREKGVALELSNLVGFSGGGIDPVIVFGKDFRPPQSFRYLTLEQFEKLENVRKKIMKIIFVAGVHAVGKTTACIHAANSLGLARYSASELIKTEKVNAIPDNGKAVADVEGNQELLIRGVRKVCERHQGKIILDGHFTLLKPNGVIEAISTDVFRALLIRGIVVYRDEPGAIVRRLEDRDKSLLSVTAIDQHQSAELEQAHLVATQLGVPIQILKAFDEVGLTRLISEWTESNK
jgi:adenylate kinase